MPSIPSCTTAAMAARSLACTRPVGTAAHGRETAPSALYCGLLSISTPLPALRFRFRAATSTLILFNSEKKHYAQSVLLPNPQQPRGVPSRPAHRPPRPAPFHKAPLSDGRPPSSALRRRAGMAPSGAAPQHAAPPLWAQQVPPRSRAVAMCVKAICSSLRALQHG